MADDKKPEEKQQKKRGPRGELGESTAGERLKREHRRARKIAGDNTPLREFARQLARGGDYDATEWLRVKGLLHP